MFKIKSYTHFYNLTAHVNNDVKGVRYFKLKTELMLLKIHNCFDQTSVGIEFKDCHGQFDIYAYDSVLNWNIKTFQKMFAVFLITGLIAVEDILYKEC